MFDVIARAIWKICRAIWLAFLTLLVGNLLLLHTTDVTQTVLWAVLQRLLQPGLPQIAFFSSLGLFLALTISSGFYVAVQAIKPAKKLISDREALERYLAAVIDDNRELGIVVFDPRTESSTKIFPPLEEIFVHLNAVSVSAVPDESYGGDPTDAQLQNEERFQRPALTIQEQESLKRSKTDWGEGAPIDIENILQGLTATYPAAVILGEPGSGKSTALRWFAFRMAQAYRFPNRPVASALLPRQIPLLIPLKEYETYLRDSGANGQEHTPKTFKTFLKRYVETQFGTKIYGEQAKEHIYDLLLTKLQEGACLLLIDGLDEVFSKEKEIAEEVAAFIRDYSPLDDSSQHLHNRFIISSRLVGYIRKGQPLARYSRYFLQHFNDEQIRQLLTNLTRRYSLPNGEVQVLNDEQKDRIIDACHRQPSIMRLAMNPETLTLLASTQRIQKLPDYKRVTLFTLIIEELLKGKYEENGQRSLESWEIEAAKQFLGLIAYRRYQRAPTPTREDLVQELRQFLPQAKQEQASPFLEKLRNLDLFVNEQFSYTRRTYEEFLVALHLVRMPDFRAFAEKHFRKEAPWREPLLMAIAYKSKINAQQAGDVIRAILHTEDASTYDHILHRNLLFSASSLVDCNVWNIDESIQQDIGNRLFDLYGDWLQAGRYTLLRRKIEEVALLLLREQDEKTDGRRRLSPLLETWQSALGQAEPAARQEGAISLLAAIAPNLPSPSCPPLVLQTFLPSLLALAGAQNWSFHQRVNRHIAIQPVPQRVQEFAFLTLRLLDKEGPAGWLHEEWQRISRDDPKMLERLTRHAIEIEFLLTPAALPQASDPNCQTHLHLLPTLWKRVGQQEPVDLQRRLLNASNAAHYPHAFLLKQVLEAEFTSSPDSVENTAWKERWDALLQAEMKRGSTATYQPCLGLRLVLWQQDKECYLKLAEELMEALATKGPQQIQALIVITNIYLQDLRNLRMSQFISERSQMRDLRYLRDSSRLVTLSYLHELRDLADLVDLHDLRWLLNVEDLVHSLQDQFTLLGLQALRDALDQDRIVSILRRLINREKDALLTEALLCLYSIVASSPSPTLRQQVRKNILNLQGKQAEFATEQRLLVNALLQSTRSASPGSSSTPRRPADERALDLYAMMQQGQTPLDKFQVEELLDSCLDTRRLTSDARSKIPGRNRAVQEVGWTLITRGNFRLENEALDWVVESLDNNRAIICAGAALLLQQHLSDSQDNHHNKEYFSSAIEQASAKVAAILKDESRSRRPLEPPDASNKIRRLDDVLFETLEQILAE
jgi:hypothetical protein